MLVGRVRLTNLRSRRALEVMLGSGVTIIVGPNGAGKTTVLEAITLLLRGTMLRAGTVRDLITRGEDLLRVEMQLEDGGASIVAAAAYSRGGERRFTADGTPLGDSSRWRRVLPLQTFVPDDLRIVKGSPRRRREYLDALARRCWQAYPDELERYEEALAQRNNLLRTARLGRDGGEFVPWEAILARTGLVVSRARETALAAFISAFQRTYADLTGEAADSLRLVYRTNVSGLDEEGYRQRLAETREADRHRTYTHLGPHRDDLRIVRRGFDVREYASQGEQRVALLVLVLAEWEYLTGSTQSSLLLLDDVMSELDEARRRALMAIVRRGGQVAITTTDLRYFSSEELRDACVIELSPE